MDLQSPGHGIAMPREDLNREVERLRAELAASKAQQALFAATLESSEEGVIALQFDSKDLFYNTAFARMWSLPNAPAGLMPRDQLVPFQAALVKDKEQFLAQIDAYDRDAEDFNLVEMLDGRLLERRARPQRVQGRTVGRVITYRDITRRMQFEQKMIFNQVVLENTGPMVWIDRDTDAVVYANRAACDQLGRTAEELVGAPASTYDPHYSKEAVAPLVDQWRRTGKPVFGLPVALSLLVFFVFALQCTSTIAVMARETGSWRWPAFAFAYMLGLAYTASFVTYRLASALAA